MKLVNFKRNNEVRIGLKTDKGILDVQEAAQRHNKTVPNTMEEFIAQNQLSTLEELQALTEKESGTNYFIGEEEVEFAPVVSNPEKVICIGLNYLKHVEEARTEDVPEAPLLFSKFNNALAAHNEPVPLPTVGEQFDYEAELVIVIGKEAKNVSKEDALSYVFGYSVGNDLSVRDLQFKSGQWLIGKTTDKFAPVGPYIVTADEVDPAHLDISLKRNGEVVQSSNTEHLIFDCATIISYASTMMTLKPGDLIFTGTPDGVILGLPENERDWLKAGDKLEVSIENVGVLRNEMV